MKYWLFAVVFLYILLRVGVVFSSHNGFMSDWKRQDKKSSDKDVINTTDLENKKKHTP
ncbi:MAG TPA: hypothetical protein PLE74_02555 [Candidatus Cloacimonadota bacterium]|nr:hypothetical protein [Candidatus Cloacimonadota bacterium]HPT71144.1 hypothetical protein [Candidatus Cloacimonadota bacterium]